eukprot:g10968.t1
MLAAAFNAAYDAWANSGRVRPSGQRAAYAPVGPPFGTSKRPEDFIYGRQEVVTEENVCHMLKIGEVLQCGALIRECASVMQRFLSDRHAEEWLREAQALNLKAVVPSADRTPKGPSNLKNLEYWTKVDEEICIEILSKDDLQVEEDDVAEFVMQVVQNVQEPAVQQALWSTVRFAGVSDAVLKKVEPSPSNFEAMAKGLRAKCLGEMPHWRGSYWTSVKGRGHVGADGRMVEFQGSGLAQSYRHRENGAGSAVGFGAKGEFGEQHIHCSEGGYATRGRGYAISVFSNGLGNVWKNGKRVKALTLPNVREGQSICCTLDAARRLVLFQVEGIEDSVSIQVDEEDLSEDFVFTVSSCTCGASGCCQVLLSSSNEVAFSLRLCLECFSSEFHTVESLQVQQALQQLVEQIASGELQPTSLEDALRALYVASSAMATSRCGDWMKVLVSTAESCEPQVQLRLILLVAKVVTELRVEALCEELQQLLEPLCRALLELLIRYLGITLFSSQLLAERVQIGTGGNWLRLLLEGSSITSLSPLSLLCKARSRDRDGSSHLLPRGAIRPSQLRDSALNAARLLRDERNEDLVLLERQEPVVLEVFWEVLLVVSTGICEEEVAVQGARRIWSFLQDLQTPASTLKRFLHLCIQEVSAENSTWWLDLGCRTMLETLPDAGHDPRGGHPRGPTGSGRRGCCLATELGGAAARACRVLKLQRGARSDRGCG